TSRASTCCARRGSASGSTSSTRWRTGACRTRAARSRTSGCSTPTGRTSPRPPSSAPSPRRAATEGPVTLFVSELPADPAAGRRVLYGGAVAHLGPTAASLALVEDTLALLREELGLSDVRSAHARLDGEDVFRRLGRVRKRLYLEPRFHEALARVV